MIFPQDVHKRIQDRNKLVGDNKVQLVIVLLVLGNVFCFFLLSFICSVMLPGVPMMFQIIVQILIMVSVGIACFRFLIFNESEKKKEYQGQQTDSFARYMYLRKDARNTMDIGDGSINVFEFVDGSASCVIEFRFGSNDDIKAEGTVQLYEEMFRCIASYGFESRVVVLPENFGKSEEFKNHIDRVNAIPDLEMRRTIMLFTDTVMSQSYEMSNVDMVYLMIRSVSNYQKQDLEMLMRNLLDIMESSVNAFRMISFLSLEDLMEFYREFYGIVAIDLAMIKTISLAEDITEDFSRFVKIYSLKSSDGKIYTTQNYDKMFTIKEKELCPSNQNDI